MRVRCVIVLLVLAGSGGLPASGSETGLDAKAAKCFTVKWSSVRYDKSVVVQNRAASTPASKQATTESLTLMCELEIRDPNVVLGTGREGVITQVTDSNGASIAVPAAPTRGRLMYEGLRCIPKFQQPIVPKWRAIIRRILGRPPHLAGPPQMVQELQPNHVSMRLDMGLLGSTGGDLRSVKGHFHALVAESMEYVDVPFEPNNTWVRLTPDVEVRVKEAVSTGNSYHFEIDMRPQSGSPMHLLMSGQPLPARMVVTRHLIGEDGKPSRHFSGGPTLMTAVAGRGSGSGSNLGVIQAIRFVIAVNATDRKIPFEVRNVPLSDPGP